MDIPYAQKILDTGVLGALLLISFVVIWSLFKLLMTEKDKRYDDALKLTDGLMEPIKQIKENGETQISLLRQFLDKVSKL